MKMYLVTVESGAICENYHVKAEAEHLAKYAATRVFYEEYPHREAQHVTVFKKDVIKV